MDVKGLAQMGVDTFNDRSFREKAKDLMDPNVVIIDAPTSQELHGPDGYVQYSEGFISAIPDLKGTAIEHKVSGNKVTSRVRGQGNFTGTMVTPQGSFPGNGNPVDIEYQIEQEFNDDGKVVRFAVDYDMQDFMRQLGV
ncbi:MAG TPA: ester cyclase [Anaerolineales bacterium]|jgi:predicted ester cyclase